MVPETASLDLEAFQKLSFPAGSRERLMTTLPAELRFQIAGTAPCEVQGGYALRYQHRGATLRSLLLLVFADNRARAPDDAEKRAIGHMVEAGSLALRQFIQRDEWLYALGRSNRGTAALVDARSVVYAASRRFRELVAAQSGTPDFDLLPFTLPESVLEENGSFVHGAMHFRVHRQGHLYQIHARQPLPLDGLSPREQQIACALGNGKTFKSVARQYDIAVSTVANHASRIYRKLGIYRREDLIQLVRKPRAAPAASRH